MPSLSLPHTRQGWLLVLLAAVALSLSWMAYQRGPVNAPPPTAAPRVGFYAPDFTLQTHTGEPFTLSELRGRGVVLNFWASWCGPCRVETPYFQALSEQYADEVVFVGVNQGESVAIIEQFAADYSLTYPLLVDGDNAINRAYAIFGLPTTLFIDGDGIIRHIIPGAVNQAVLESQVQGIMGSAE